MVNPRRIRFRVGLSDLYIPLYDRLCFILPQEWQPYSGMRDFRSQDELFAKGRTDEPIGKAFEVTGARGGESPHNYGCASDWTIFQDGKPLWMHKDDSRWQTYFDAIEKAGLLSGAGWGDVDHNELRIVRNWKEVHLAYLAGGMSAAALKIKASLFKGGIS